jgi:hypothetical protein
MTNTDDVFRKIKDMSQNVSKPRPQIPINYLASELLMTRENILQAIAQLKKMRLIQQDPNSPTLIRLTLLGFNVTQ